MLLTEETSLVGKQRRHPGQALAQFLARLHACRLLAARVEYEVDQCTPVALDAVNQQAAVGPRHRIHRQQWRVRVTLIEVFHHHGRLVQRQVAIDQGWHAAIGVHFDQLGRQASGIDIDDLDADTLLGENDAHPMRIMVSGVGVAG
ncbi:hypothetical protein D3C79_865040 [compost metagenome]